MPSQHPKGQVPLSDQYTWAYFIDWAQVVSKSKRLPSTRTVPKSICTQEILRGAQVIDVHYLNGLLIGKMHSTTALMFAESTHRDLWRGRCSLWRWKVTILPSCLISNRMGCLSLNPLEADSIYQHLLNKLLHYIQCIPISRAPAWAYNPVSTGEYITNGWAKWSQEP